MNDPSHIEQAFAYRSSPKTLRMAWGIVLMAIAAGSFFFILIPLTAGLDDAPKVLEVRPLDPKIEIEPEEEPEKDEKVYEDLKKPTPEPSTEPPTPPKPQPPPLVAIQIDPAPASFDTDLTFDKPAETEFEFDIEKAEDIVQKAPKQIPRSEHAVKTPQVHEKPDRPVEAVTDPVNYQQVFEKGEVDSAAIQPPGELQLPTRLRRRRAKGQVVISCIIDKEGRVTQVEITKNFANGRFDKECIKHAEKMRYTPAMKDGRAVAQKTIIIISIDIR